MKATYRWIKEHCNFEISPQEMLDELMMLGHEVDGTVDLGLLGNPIRTARIVAVEAHPNADALTVCRVDDGAGDEVSVVCGAPNVAEGLVGVLARAGAELPNGLKLKRTKIRGVASEGMLLAPDEMGLGTEHEGIVVLSPDTPIGEGYDLLIDVAITPNRADCLSMHGLARDLAAAHGRKAFTRQSRVKETYQSTHDMIRISIKAPEACPRYTARVVKGVRIGPSPEWVRLRLLAVGLRPINNVVDATNLALMEYGHPLHAFDYDNIRNQEIVVRMAAPGEKLTVIDGTELALENDDLVIADGVGPSALAGVMGGRDSEVGPKTENILLESAYFNPSTIRRSARRHRFSTDASYRFERGADPLGVVDALEYAASLILETAGGECPKGVVDVHPKTPAERNFVLRPDRACRVLGVEISKTAIADILSTLGFEVVRSDNEMLVVSAPSFRGDIEREEDLYEEIARVHGYARIPATMPEMPVGISRPNPRIELKRRVQDTLVAVGFNEAITLSFAARAQLERYGFNAGEALRISNPISLEYELLRPDLIPAMVRALLHNQNHGAENVAFFEIAKTYRYGDMATPCVETPALCVGMHGALRAPTWREPVPPPADLHTLKGVLETIFDALRIEDVVWESTRAAALPFLHPGRAARILKGGRTIGWAGELHPRLRAEMEFRSRPQLAELDMEALLELLGPHVAAADPPRFPGVERDLALVVDEDVPARDLAEVIRRAAGKRLESLSLFDYYAGKGVAEGKKSLGYRLVYRSAEGTLTDEDVDKAQAKVLKKLEQETGAALRT